MRRAILLFALVLGLTALATSISPTTHPNRSEPPARSVAPPPVVAEEQEQLVAFHAPPPKTPPDSKVKAADQLVVEVTSSTAGQATIPSLGLVESLTPAAPARFDVLLPGPGRYDVLFAPALGTPQRIGTVVGR